MATLTGDRTVLTEVFVVAKSINSLGQIEASVARVVVALSGPLVECDTVYLSMTSACAARDRLDGFSADETDSQEDGTCCD
jgi:hypothetical protein